MCTVDLGPDLTEMFTIRGPLWLRITYQHIAGHLNHVYDALEQARPKDFSCGWGRQNQEIFGLKHEQVQGGGHATIFIFIIFMYQILHISTLRLCCRLGIWGGDKCGLREREKFTLVFGLRSHQILRVWGNGKGGEEFTLFFFKYKIDKP